MITHVHLIAENNRITVERVIHVIKLETTRGCTLHTEHSELLNVLNAFLRFMLVRFRVHLS